MKLYYIKAKVIIRMENIHGPYEETVSHLVTAASVSHAKEIYERHVSSTKNHLEINRISFDYLEIATSIS